MVAVNALGIITVFNAAAGRLMGVEPEDMVGQVAEEVIPNTRLHIVLKQVRLSSIRSRSWKT